ncbi:MAG: hypothetical protein ABSE15_12340 [Candidatus Bathyarchaeia archaeon]
MPVPSYNMAVGHEASYAVSQDANTTVAVHNSKPLKFREIYVGAASLEFGWVSTGKTSSWISSETMLDPTPAQHSETLADDGQTQIINVELGSKMFPATGLVDPSFGGEIIAPAIHFDVPHGYDLWIFLLRSPWFPIKINVEKSLLNIAHNLAQATAEIESVNLNVGEQTLRADVSVHGDGFKEVQLSIKYEESLFGRKPWQINQWNGNLRLETHSKKLRYAACDSIKHEFGCIRRFSKISRR